MRGAIDFDERKANDLVPLELGKLSEDGSDGFEHGGAIGADVGGGAVGGGGDGLVADFTLGGERPFYRQTGIITQLLWWRDVGVIMSNCQQHIVAIIDACSLGPGHQLIKRRRINLSVGADVANEGDMEWVCLLYTSPSPRDPE